MPDAKPPFTPAQMRSAWLVAQQDADLKTQERLKTAATTSAGRLAVILAVFTGLGFSFSPEKLLTTHPEFQKWLLVILFLVVISALLSQLFASSASAEPKLTWQSNDGSDYRKSIIEDAAATVRYLNWSRWALSVAVAGLLSLFALYFTAPYLAEARHLSTNSIVKLANGRVACGIVTTKKDGTLWLHSSSGVQLPLNEAPTMTPATRCPSPSNDSPVVADLAQIKSTKNGVRCGFLQSDANGQLWLQPANAGSKGVLIDAKDEIATVLACPPLKATLAN